MYEFDKEIKKLEQEDAAVQMQAKNYIDDFIADIRKVDKTAITQTYSQPQKLKIPFKVRIRRFFNKLNKTIG